MWPWACGKKLSPSRTSKKLGIFLKMNLSSNANNPNHIESDQIKRYPGLIRCLCSWVAQRRGTESRHDHQRGRGKTRVKAWWVQRKGLPKMEARGWDYTRNIGHWTDWYSLRVFIKLVFPVRKKKRQEIAQGVAGKKSQTPQTASDSISSWRKVFIRSEEAHACIRHTEQKPFEKQRGDSESWKIQALLKGWHF